MLPNPVYQPPVSNIAYHVYNPEDDLERVQAVSQRAFQRIMDSYTEYERLADHFQVEHDKHQKLVRERKEREKLLKQQQKKQSKRQGQGYPSRSQDRNFPLPATPFERQTFRRFHRNTTTPFVPHLSNNIGTDSGLDSFLTRKAGLKLDITNVCYTHRQDKGSTPLYTLNYMGPS